MVVGGNGVLVTGGASGIGLALATRFLQAGSEVIICGRREEKLREAAAAHPGLRTRRCDVASEDERIALCEWAVRELPALNVLVNNAGIQRYPSLAEPEPWRVTRDELTINLEAPMHLCALLIPHLSRQPRSAIVNITSGLSFVPMARAPVYCATKAALHSYTQSLRHHLAETTIGVIEIIPPAVDTDLGGPGLHTFGVKVDALADAAIQGIERGETEIAHGNAADARAASAVLRDEIFRRMNQPRR